MGSEEYNPTITITGDTTHEALQTLINQGIDKYGSAFTILLSVNLRFENQNREIKEWKKLYEKQKELYERQRKLLKESERQNDILVSMCQQEDK